MYMKFTYLLWFTYSMAKNIQALFSPPSESDLKLGRKTESSSSEKCSPSLPSCFFISKQLEKEILNLSQLTLGYHFCLCYSSQISCSMCLYKRKSTQPLDRAKKYLLNSILGWVNLKKILLLHHCRGRHLRIVGSLTYLLIL